MIAKLKQVLVSLFLHFLVLRFLHFLVYQQKNRQKQKKCLKSKKPKTTIDAKKKDIAPENKNSVNKNKKLENTLNNPLIRKKFPKIIRRQNEENEENAGNDLGNNVQEEIIATPQEETPAKKV